MNWRSVKPVTSITLACLVMLFAFVTGGGSVSAQEAEEPTAELSVAPVNAEGGFFNLTLSPGETGQFQVEVRNSGAADGDAYLYLADVSTRVNGGMAVALANEPVSGSALWIDFSDESLPVEAGTAVTRTFTIQVPDDAAPGEHLTSIVIQDAGELEAADAGVMLRTVSRQALGILVTVPGPVTPELEIGTAGYTTVGDRTVVTFQATNSGNVRLRTTGEFTLTDSNGRDVFSTSVEYSSIYAHTSATLEVPLDTLLEPGDYMARLQLADAVHQFEVESGSLAFTVSMPETPAAPNPQSPETVTEAEAEPVQTTQPSGIPTWTLLVAIPAAVVLGALIAVGGVLGLRRRSQPATAAPEATVAQRVVVREAPARATRPATVRKMMPPGRSGIDRGEPSAPQGDFD